jgi:hypothetical protein
LAALISLFTYATSAQKDSKKRCGSQQVGNQRGFTYDLQNGILLQQLILFPKKNKNYARLHYL